MSGPFAANRADLRRVEFGPKVLSDVRDMTGER